LESPQNQLSDITTTNTKKFKDISFSNKINHPKSILGSNVNCNLFSLKDYPIKTTFSTIMKKQSKYKF